MRGCTGPSRQQWHALVILWKRQCFGITTLWLDTKQAHMKVFGLRPKLPGVRNHREVVDRELDHDSGDKVAEQGLDENPLWLETMCS